MITNQERDAFIAGQLNQGVSLSDVQKALSEQFGLRMTYLELRMLAADLKVDWQKQDKAPAAPAPEAESETDTAPQDNDGLDGDVPDDAGIPDEGDGLPPTSGKTHVTVSKLARPGASLNGEVTFASGAHGEWFIDGMGRLGLSLAEGSPKPDNNDYREFQIELQKALGY